MCWIAFIPKALKPLPFLIPCVGEDRKEPGNPCSGPVSYAGHLRWAAASSCGGGGGGEMLRMQDPLAPPHSWSLFYCFQLEKKDMQII